MGLMEELVGQHYTRKLPKTNPKEIFVEQSEIAHAKNFGWVVHPVIQQINAGGKIRMVLKSTLKNTHQRKVLEQGKWKDKLDITKAREWLRGG